MNKLSELTVRNLKPTGTARKVFDGQGLYLELTATGSKLWRLKYRHAGKEKRLALGKYPATSLADARRLRNDARTTLAAGFDPSAVKRTEATKARVNTFDQAADAWLERNGATWTPKTALKHRQRLDNNVRPWLGARPIADITPQEVIDTLKRIEGRGTVDMAHRIAQDLRRVFRFAVQLGLITSNPAADMREIIKPHKKRHYAAPTEPMQAAGYLKMFDAFQGSHTVRTALLLAPLLFCRPGELRMMEWAEIEGDLWKIPAAKMKMRQPHIVPLSRQAQALLSDLKPYTGASRYVFPNERTSTRPMSDAAVNAALKRLGIDTKTELTGHGFRAMARTLAHEQLGIHPDVLERQLAHSTAGALGATYNRTQFLLERIAAMQAWADYLDALKNG